MNAVIIGGGVMGMLTALELVRTGWRVTLLERRKTGQEASWAGGGIVSPLYPWRYPPAVTALAQQAQAAYPALADELHQASGIDPELTPCGMLMLDAEDVRDAVVWARRQQRELQLVAGRDLGRFGEGLERFDQGIWLPGIANIRNPRLLAALRETLRVKGVVLVEDQEADTWEQEQGRVLSVTTVQGRRFEADHFVVAAGAWSARLLAGQGGGVAVRPIKGQMLLYHAPGAVRHILMHQGHYLIPRRDGHVLCGSTLEDTGFDKGTSEEALRLLHQAASRLCPALAGLRPVRQWAGLRPASPNGIPYMGKAPGTANLWVSAGHYRNGLVLAPASARLLADLMSGRPPVVDPTPYQLL